MTDEAIDMSNSNDNCNTNDDLQMNIEETSFITDNLKLNDSMNDMTFNDMTFNDMMNVNDLSDDELIDIMSYLSITERLKVTCVCKRWNTIVGKTLKAEKELKCNIIFKHNEYHFISEENMSKIIERCPNVRIIDLSGFGIDYSSNELLSNDIKECKAIISIANHCHQLESINFGHHRYGPEVSLIAENCPNLKVFVSSNILDEDFEKLITNAKNLQHIDVSYNDNIIGLSFSLLNENIRELYIEECPEITDISLTALCEGYGRNIRKLSLDIRSALSFQLICNSLKDLTHLKMCLYINGCEFKDLKKLKKLKNLKLMIDNSCEFRSDDFVTIVKSVDMQSLTELEFVLKHLNSESINDDSLKVLLRLEQTIEKLVIRGSNAVTNIGMNEIGKLSKLKSLDLMECDSISIGINEVIKSCTELRYLNLHNCTQVTVDIVYSMIEKAKADPNNQYFIDVIGTVVDDIERDFPPNFSCLWKDDDCNFSCNHGWNDHPYGYESDPEFYDNFDEYDIEDFDDEDDYDDYDLYNDEDDDGDAYHF